MGLLQNIGMKTVDTEQLSIAYYECGDPSGWCCILNHGFPYDVHCYEACIEPLVAQGARIIVPSLRGYGATRFRDKTTIRSGEQAVLGNDLLQLMDSLSIEKAVVAGYDWGGRAACIVSALWPERVHALVTGNSYNIQNIAASMQPASASEESSLWYQYYFHSERGRNGLQENRAEIAKLLWKQWSPTWEFSDQTFNQSAESFNNPDFVDVVIHSYRHRYALVDGDPSVLAIEQQLSAQPSIRVPTIAIVGDVNGVSPATEDHKNKFTGPYEYRLFQNTGHNLPQERPALWVRAVLDAKAMEKDTSDR